MNDRVSKYTKVCIRNCKEGLCSDTRSGKSTGENK